MPINEWTIGIGAVVLTVIAAGGGAWLKRAIFGKKGPSA